MTRKRARSNLLRALFCTHFYPGAHPFASPIFSLSGGLLQSESPKISSCPAKKIHLTRVFFDRESSDLCEISRFLLTKRFRGVFAASLVLIC